MSTSSLASRRTHLHLAGILTAAAGLAWSVLTAAPATAQIPSQAPDSSGVYETARHSFRVETVVPDLDFPWSMTWLPTGEMLVVERPGRVRVVRDGILDPTALAGLPTPYRDRGQGGYMDVLLHPDFESNRLLYLSYGKPNADGSEGALAVIRGRLEDERVSDVEEVFVADAWHGNNNHFSGRMAFGPDGHLFVTVGDRQYAPQLLGEHPAQDVTDHVGTIVRLHDDGRVPSDNPFVGHASARPEIFSYGHRNMQGLAADPVTGHVWANEHGPRGGDELNLVLPGRNYGWPVVSHGVDYDGSVFTPDAEAEGMESPRYVWTPSIGTSGMLVYRGEAFPWWRGDAFVAGMAGEQLVRVELVDDDALGEEVMLRGQLGRIRDVRAGPDGFIYLALEDRDGGLMPVVRLVPVAGEVRPPPP